MNAAGVSTWLRTERGRIWLRYAAASMITVVVGQAVLGVGFGILGWSARWANVVAFAVAGALSYQLNRAWAWGKPGRSDLFREIVPFWVVATAGLALSTWAVGAAEELSSSLTRVRSVQTALVMVASLLATGILWLAKFVIFDQLLFGPDRTQVREPPLAGEGSSPESPTNAAT